jgi:hypothetical protein
MHLFGHNLDHDYCSNSLVKGSRTPYQFLGVLVHTMAMSGVPRANGTFSTTSTKPDDHGVTGFIEVAPIGK